MTERTEVGGSAPRWGPLFGARATDWAQSWEGRNGWGISVYGHVLDHARIGAGTRVLDCGCGAGRFARMVPVRAIHPPGPAGHGRTDHGDVLGERRRRSAVRRGSEEVGGGDAEPGE